jgi:hypothetical protein
MAITRLATLSGVPAGHTVEQEALLLVHIYLLAMMVEEPVAVVAAISAGLVE